MLGALPLYPAFLGSAGRPEPLSPRESAGLQRGLRRPDRAAGARPRRPRHAGCSGTTNSGARSRRRTRSTLVDYETVLHLRRQVLAPMAEALLAPGRRPAATRSAPGSTPTPSCWPTPASGRRATGSATGRAPWRVARPPREGRATPSRPSGTTCTRSGWRRSNSARAGARGPALRRSPHRRPPRRFRPALGARVLRRAGRTAGRHPTSSSPAARIGRFPPSTPSASGTTATDYFIGVLRRAFRHAAYVRVDHIMGLQRLYWIPEGFDARHGAYVSYRAGRAACGASPWRRTGPARSWWARTWVPCPTGCGPAWPKTACCAPGFCSSNRPQVDPLPPVPSGVLASWGTHDLPRFVSYLFGGRHRRARARRKPYAQPRLPPARVAGRAAARRVAPGPAVSTRDPTRAAWPHGRSGGACSSGLECGGSGRWSTWRICGGSTSRRTGRAPGPVPPTGGAAGPHSVGARRDSGTTGFLRALLAAVRDGAGARGTVGAGWRRCDERGTTAASAQASSPDREPALGGRPLFVQRGDPPPHWATSSAPTSEPGGGVSFAVWAPNATRGGRHRGLQLLERRRRRAPGPGQLGDLGGDGGRRRCRARLQVRHHDRGRATVLEKADPFARRAESAPRTGSVVWDLGYEWGDQPGCRRGARDIGARRARSRSTRSTWAAGAATRATRQRFLGLRRGGGAADRSRAAAGLHPRRVPAADGAPLLRVLGLPDDRLLRPDEPLRHAPGAHVPDRPAAPGRHRGDLRLGAVALPRRPVRPGAASTARTSTSTPTPASASTPTGRA